MTDDFLVIRDKLRVSKDATTRGVYRVSKVLCAMGSWLVSYSMEHLYCLLMSICMVLCQFVACMMCKLYYEM